MDKPLAGKVAVVTGCGQSDGIGAAVARELSSAGARTVVSGRPLSPGHSDNLEALTQELGDPTSTSPALRADISSEGDCRALVNSVTSQLGRLDILVNNASAAHGADRVPVEQLELEEWQRVIRVNLTGTFLMCKAGFGVMKAHSWGRIVNISSIAAIRGYENRSAYSASKAGILGLTRALASEGAPFGVTVNAICVGAVETRRARSTAIEQAGAANVPAFFAARGRTIPMGRMGTGKDVANMVAFLSLPSSEFVTGQCLVIDGGSTAITGKPK